MTEQINNLPKNCGCYLCKSEFKLSSKCRHCSSNFEMVIPAICPTCMVKSGKIPTTNDCKCNACSLWKNKFKCHSCTKEFALVTPPRCFSCVKKVDKCKRVTPLLSPEQTTSSQKSATPIRAKPKSTRNPMIVSGIAKFILFFTSQMFFVGGCNLIAGNVPYDMIGFTFLLVVVSAVVSAIVIQFANDI